MITEKQLIKKGWIKTLAKGFAPPHMEKTIGWSTYSCYFNEKKDTLSIRVFVRQNPDEMWAMSMWAPLFNGRCPTITTFNYIFKLVSTYQ